MKRALVVLMLLSASVAYAARAYFTGRQESGTSVTGKYVTSCEYDYAGQKFWRTFSGMRMCPMSVEVE